MCISACLDNSESEVTDNYSILIFPSSEEKVFNS